MKSINLVEKFLTVTAIASALTWQASATIVYDMPNGLAGNDLNGNANYYSVGNIFNVNTAGSVTRMGMFDFSKDGFVGTLSVGIFQQVGAGFDTAGDWSLVPGTYTTFNGTYGAGDYVNSAVMQNLGSPVLLTPGVYAIVAGGGGTTADPYWNSSLPGAGSLSLTFDSNGGALSQINHASWYIGSPDPGLTAWPSAGGTYLSPYGAGTFDFAVPEASQFALAGIALLGLVYFGRCYVLRTKLA